MENSSVSPESIRESALAGTWYPGTKAALQQQIDEMLQNVPPQTIEGRLRALIVPHAGYIYSGQVAAYGYQLLRGSKFTRAVLIGPSHRAYYPGVIATDKDYYETPLGLVKVDRPIIDKLARSVQMAYVSQDAEHSVEIQVPFLQRTLTADLTIVPLVLGDQSLELCEKLAATLAQAAGDESTIFIASSDLSHFHNYRQAVTLDRRVSEKIEAFDPFGVHQAVDSGEAEACGYGAITTVLLAARALGANKAEVLRYANSGDVTGDLSNVVGYLAAAITAI